MNSLIETLNRWSCCVTGFGWPMLWQSSLLIVAVFAIDLALRKRVRAAVRHALWVVVLVKLLLPPSLALPTGLGWWLQPRHAQPVKPKPSFVVTYENEADVQPVPVVETPYTPPPPRLSPAAWVLVGWSAVGIGLLGWLLIRWRQIVNDIRRATPAPDWLNDLLAETQRQAGVRRGIQLRLTERAMSPAVCGFLRPVVLLPCALSEKLPPTRLHAVLLHELIHLRRGDVWVNCAQALLQIVYWWHPLLWLANARIRRVREEAVDDAVMLALADNADAYPPTLLEVAKLAFNRPLASLGLVGILESRSALRQRIERLVNFKPPGRAGLSVVSLLGIAAFTALAVPMGEAPPKPNGGLISASNLDARWPDPRFQSYKGINLEAQFFSVDESSLRAVLPAANGTLAPMVVTSNEVADLERKLKQAKARSCSENAPMQFQKFSGGLIHYRVGGCTNNIVNFQTKIVGGRTNIVATDVQFVATQPDWTPIEFILVPWDESDSVRCQMTLTPVDNADAAQPAEAAIPLGGAMLLATSKAASTGQRQLVLLRETTDEPARSPSATNNSSPDNASRVESAVLSQNGKLLYEKGKLDEAEAELRKAASLDPGNQAVLYYLSLISEARYTAAQRNFERAMGPEFPPPAKPDDKTNLVFTGTGRRDILNKLERIRLDTVAYDGLPLGEVVRNLMEESQKRDPEKRGINFLITAYAQSAPAINIDPATGQPVASTETVDLKSVAITINPPLADLRLVDVLDAIVKVADKPIRYSIEDYAVVFSWKGQEGDPLYTRVYKVDPRTFYQALGNAVVVTSGQTNGGGGSMRFLSQTNSLPEVAAAVRNFFLALGVDLKAPKAVYLHPNDGRLLVRASLQDLDLIEAAIQTLNAWPSQINVKTRFIEMPDQVAKSLLAGLSATNNVVSLTAILTEPATKALLKTLEAHDGVKALTAPEVTTLSGRQVHFESVDLMTIVTGINPQALAAPGVLSANGTNGLFQTKSMGIGPTLDIIPYLQKDGYSIEMSVIPTVTEFLGYDKPTNSIMAHVDGKKQSVPVPLPQIRKRTMTSRVIVWDGQTVVLGGLSKEEVQHLKSKVPVQGDLPLLGKSFRSESQTTRTNSLIVFVTPTIIDPAGNRVHSDEDMPFARELIPQQSQR